MSKTSTYGELKLVSSSVDGAKTIVNLSQARTTEYKTTTQLDSILGSEGTTAETHTAELTCKLAVATATVANNGGVEGVLKVLNQKKLAIKHSYFRNPQWDGHQAFFREGAGQINGMYCVSTLVEKANAESYIEPVAVAKEVIVVESVAE